MMLYYILALVEHNTTKASDNYIHFKNFTIKHLKTIINILIFSSGLKKAILNLVRRFFSPKVPFSMKCYELD